MEFPLCKEDQMHEVTQFNAIRKIIEIWWNVYKINLNTIIISRDL